MAALSNSTTARTGVMQTGQRVLAEPCVLSGDYVAGSETLDVSDRVGAIRSIQLGHFGAYDLALDTTNSDLANASVVITVTHWANHAAVAANTDLSGVTFYPVIFAEPKLD